MPSAGRQCALERGRRVLACICTSQGSWQTTEGVQRREKAERAELRNIAKILSKAQKSLGKAETEPKLPTGRLDA